MARPLGSERMLQPPAWVSDPVPGEGLPGARLSPPEGSSLRLGQRRHPPRRGLLNAVQGCDKLTTFKGIIRPIVLDPLDPLGTPKAKALILGAS